MSKEKFYLFSKFSNDESKLANELKIIDSKNIKFDSNGVSSWSKFIDVFDYLFSNEKSLEIKDLNIDIINKTTKIIPYEYFDDENKKFNFRLFLITSNFELFELNFDSNLFENKHEFLNENINIFQCENELYFLSQNGDYLLVENSDEIVTSCMPNISKFCYSNDRLFFVTFSEPFKVYNAEKTSLKNLSIDLTKYDYFEIKYESGNIISIDYILNKIFITCSYEILRLNLEENNISLVQKLSTIILKNSVKVFNDNLIFSTKNHLYLFDGNSIKQLGQFKYSINKNNAIFILFNEKYYIFTRDNASFIVEFDLIDFRQNLISVNNVESVYDFKSLSFYNLIFCLFVGDLNYQNITLCEDGTIENETQILFENLSFDSLFLKAINRLKIDAIGGYDFIIKTERESYSFSGMNSTLLENINICGTHFSFEIKSSTNFLLKSIGCNVSFLEG